MTEEQLREVAIHIRSRDHVVAVNPETGEEVGIALRHELQGNWSVSLKVEGFTTLLCAARVPCYLPEVLQRKLVVALLKEAPG
jgi:hypothetical protein